MSGVVFRTDASTVIGTGHVMRCLTLAAKLKESGAQVAFVCREHAGHLCDMIEDRWGFAVYRLPRDPNHDKQSRRSDADLAHAGWLDSGRENDAAETTAAISTQFKYPDWLVVDHYALDARWEAALRPLTRNLMVIDDLADRHHDCDVLLDQNLHRNIAKRYDDLVPAHCCRLLGPQYALLRPEFQIARKKLRVRDGTVRQVLIFFGGMDAHNETSKAIEAITSINRPDLTVDVIVGATNPNLENIRSICARLAHVRLHHNPGNIAELIANADLSIGAAGATAWERCCLGLPSIMISLAMNQESIAHALADDGLAIYLGKRAAVTAGMITAAVEELMRNPDRMKAMGRACAELTDGNGAKRVACALDSHPIVLRPAQIGDCDSLYQWRNAEETRRYFHHPEPISIETHRDWLTSVLRNKSRSLLIGQRNGEPVGVLRYDCARTQCAVSIYLVPSQRGHGYGSRLLCAGHEWLRQNRQNIRQVRAEVVKANRASVGAFLQAGYVKDDGVFVKQIA